MEWTKDRLMWLAEAHNDPRQLELFEDLAPSAAEISSQQVRCSGWTPDPPTPDWKETSDGS